MPEGGNIANLLVLDKSNRGLGDFNLNTLHFCRSGTRDLRGVRLGPSLDNVALVMNCKGAKPDRERTGTGQSPPRRFSFLAKLTFDPTVETGRRGTAGGLLSAGARHNLDGIAAESRNASPVWQRQPSYWNLRTSSTNASPTFLSGPVTAPSRMPPTLPTFTRSLR